MDGPQSLLLLGTAVPVGGFLISALARWIAQVWGHEFRMGWAASTLCGVAGAAIGAGLTAIAVNRPARQVPVLVAAGGLVGTLVLLVAVDWLIRRQRPPLPSARELIAAGESGGVEFKSTARFNRHTRTRDPRLELVVASSVAAFLNAHGGTLLIGVDDDGTPLGLQEDYRLVKAPTRDRYELWLRDLLTGTLGATAAAAVTIDFENIDEHDVCLLRVPASPRPVFLRPPKQSGSEFVVRIGNSSRHLPPHELVEYVGTRWRRQALRPPRRLGRAAAVSPTSESEPGLRD